MRSQMRSYCLYKGNILDIADMYQVIDGKQINIPEKLKYYRELSNTHSELTCSCGCGDVVVLVAGSVRRQHFRLLKGFRNPSCEYQEENELTIHSKTMLKCWMLENLPILTHEIGYKVPISEIVDNNRRYELTLYHKDYDFGIVYYRLSSNIETEKINLQHKYLNTKILYVTAIQNEFTDDQYPEHMMKIQEKQGFCFYLNMDSDTDYKEVRAKVSVYLKDYKGLWKSVVVCAGFLTRYKLEKDGTILFDGKKVENLVLQETDAFQNKQNEILAQIQKEEEERQRQIEEKRRLREIENEKLIECLKKEEEERKEKQRLLEIENAKRLERLRIENEEREKKVAEEKRREAEEKERRRQEEIKEFLKDNPKFTKIYDMLLELDELRGSFGSEQSDGTTRDYRVNLKINQVDIDTKRHAIKVVQDFGNKVYFYILEEGFTSCQIPRTGAAYRVLDYSRISDVEQHFKMAFQCIFKKQYAKWVCSFPDSRCQFLSENNSCICENSCMFQKC